MEGCSVKAKTEDTWQTTAGVPAGSKSSDTEPAPKKDTAKAKTESTHLYKNGRRFEMKRHVMLNRPGAYNIQR